MEQSSAEYRGFVFVEFRPDGTAVLGVDRPSQVEERGRPDLPYFIDDDDYLITSGDQVYGHTASRVIPYPDDEMYRWWDEAEVRAHANHLGFNLPPSSLRNMRRNHKIYFTYNEYGNLRYDPLDVIEKLPLYLRDHPGLKKPRPRLIAYADYCNTDEELDEYIGKLCWFRGDAWAYEVNSRTGHGARIEIWDSSLEPNPDKPHFPSFYFLPSGLFVPFSENAEWYDKLPYDALGIRLYGFKPSPRDVKPVQVQFAARMGRRHDGMQPKWLSPYDLSMFQPRFPYQAQKLSGMYDDPPEAA